MLNLHVPPHRPFCYALRPHVLPHLPVHPPANGNDMPYVLLNHQQDLSLPKFSPQQGEAALSRRFWPQFNRFIDVSRPQTHTHAVPHIPQILKKVRQSSTGGRASPFDAVASAAAAARHDLSVAQLDALLAQLGEYRAEAEQNEREGNMELLLQFLQHSREDKARKLAALQRELACLDTDIGHVASTVDPRSGSAAAGEQLAAATAAAATAALEQASAQQQQQDGLMSPVPEGGPHKAAPSPSPPPAATTAAAQQHEAAVAAAMERVGPRYPTAAYTALAAHPGMATYMQTQMGGTALPPAAAAAGGAASGTTSEEGKDGGGALRNKRRRIAAQFDDLQSAYLRLRADRLRPGDGDGAVPPTATASSPRVGAAIDEGLHEFSRLLSVLSRCNRLVPLAEIPRPALRQASSIISSVEFDRDGGLFATAGVSKRISVFEHAAVARAPRPLVHCPVVEMVSRSKLSCLSWNRYVASHLASSDYEGVVTVWDVAASSMVQEYEAHARRIWSVDYCSADPTLLASGSDDCTVKLWSTRAQAAVAQLDLRANVCAVKWCPGSAHQLAVGSADHNVYTYDVRHPAKPLATLTGHRKAVSYVRWAGEGEVVSASTDSTLRLWDAAGGDGAAPERIYEGHSNEKNFVGLGVEGDFIACGSETNEAFVYFKPLSKPVARLAFGDGGLLGPGVGHGGGEDAGGGGGGGDDKTFISAVCWRPGGEELLVADSQGTVRLLQLTGSG